MTHIQSLLPGVSHLWDLTLGTPDVTIAILDGPIDQSHTAFHGCNIEQLPGVISTASPDGPSGQHGTHIASILLGRHGSEVHGIAPECRGVVVPIFHDSPAGIVPCSEEELARSIQVAADAGANLINVSGGRLSMDGRAGRHLQEAVRRCDRDGILLIAAAGNDGCQCHQVPAAIESVLAVGACDSLGVPLEFSNWGPLYRTHGVLAVGQDVIGALPGGGVVARTGTSFAAPQVTGIAALLMSLQRSLDEPLNPASVRAAIVNGATGCRAESAGDCDRVLAGQIHVGRTLDLFNKGAIEVTDFPESTLEEPVVDDSVVAAEVVDQPGQQPDAVIASESSATTSADADGITARTVPGPAANVTTSPSRISPSACGCGGNAAARIVYALGRIGYDFGTQARYDSFLQYMRAYFWKTSETDPLAVNPNNPEQMVEYLHGNPESATDLIWTLRQSDTTLYSIKPTGAFAEQTYALLREFLHDQYVLIDVPDSKAKIPLSEVNAIPGYLAGNARLLNGQVVETILPDYRGMANWNIEKLIDVAGDALAEEIAKVVEARADDAVNGDVLSEIRSFLSRIYYEFENMGADPADRALNYAGTNLWEIFRAFWKEVQGGFVLSTFSVQPSKICRPDSSCWDVKLTFFDPRDLNQARNQYLLTIDVSDVIPVSLGLPKHWAIY